MRKAIRGFLMIFFAYLLQVTAVPDMAVFGVSPNLLISVIAISTVAYSRKAAFCLAAMTGILTETMIPGMPGISIVLYPALGFVGSVIFSDKSERKIEEEIASGKPGKNKNPLLRTLLCAAGIAFVFQVIYVAYAYLVSMDITVNLVLLSLFDVGYTTVLTLVIMIPLRYALGLHRRAKKVKPQES